jgi:hypothetical protein
VQLATGPASRRALAKVGKVAATTDNTIHVSTPAPRAEVIAHELTHVAHPSPIARFFDDDDRGPEERQAERVAAVMRGAPLLPRMSPAGVDTVQRVTISKHRAGKAKVPAAPPDLTATTTPPPSPPQALPTTQATTETTTDASTAPAPSTDAMFDRILELLEDRILTELERRGGRFRGGF